MTAYRVDEENPEKQVSADLMVHPVLQENQEYQDQLVQKEQKASKENLKGLVPKEWKERKEKKDHGDSQVKIEFSKFLFKRDLDIEKNAEINIYISELYEFFDVFQSLAWYIFC